MKKVLVIYPSSHDYVNTIYDYIAAFDRYSRHDVYYCDILWGSKIFLDLSFFDAVIIERKIMAQVRKGLWNAANEEIIRNFKGLKIVIAQDEHTYINRSRAFLENIGANLLLSTLPLESCKYLYGTPGLAGLDFMHALTGYVLSRPKPANFRPLDKTRWEIGYRGRPQPYKYGSLCREKIIIGERMKAICQARSISHNIAFTEEERIYAEAWPEFIRDCKAMLGTESGSNALDFDGELERRIDNYLSEHPDATFEEVHELFLKDLENRVVLNQVSPRIFECIEHGSVMINFEGNYSGVIRPWEHYIPLKKDFSNIDEVLNALKDNGLLERIRHKAYEDVILSGEYGYDKLVARIDDYIDEHAKGAQNWKMYMAVPRIITNDNRLVDFADNLSFMNKLRYRFAERVGRGVPVKGMKARQVWSVKDTTLGKIFVSTVAAGLYQIGRIIRIRLGKVCKRQGGK